MAENTTPPPPREPGEGEGIDPARDAAWPTGSGHGSSAYGGDGGSGSGTSGYGEGANGSYGTGAYGTGASGNGGAYGNASYGGASYGAGAPNNAYGAANSGYGAYPAYGAPAGGAPASPGNGMAITALILGIVALVLCWLPFFGLISVLLGVAAIVLGVLALRRRQSKGMALTGLITGAIALLASIIITALASMVLSTAGDAAGSAFSSLEASFSSQSASMASASTTEHTVELIASVDKGAATADYRIGGSASKESLNAEEITITDTITGMDSVSLSVSEDFSADQTVEDATYTCTIKIDGNVEAEESGSTMAICSADTFDF